MTPTDGQAMANIALTMSLVAKLIAKNILTQEEAEDIIDHARVSLKEGGLADPVTRNAHQVLGQFRTIWHPAEDCAAKNGSDRGYSR